MEEELLKFLTTAYAAQKQMIAEAWEVWTSDGTIQEAWQNGENGDGFKDFLINFINEDLKKHYAEAGIKYPEEK